MITGKDPAYIADPTKSYNISGPKKQYRGKVINSEFLSQYLYSTSLHVDANSILLESIQHLPASIQNSIYSINDLRHSPIPSQEAYYHSHKFNKDGRKRKVRSDGRSFMARAASVLIAAMNVATGELGYKFFIPTMAILAQRAQMSIRTFFSHIRTFKKLGILEVNQNRKLDSKTNHWYSNVAFKKIKRGFLNKFLPESIANRREKSLKDFKRLKLTGLKPSNIVITKTKNSSEKGINSLKAILSNSKFFTEPS